MEKQIKVYSIERGLRTLKVGATLAEYKAKYPTAIKVTVPSMTRLERYAYDSVCPAIDGCRVEPDGECPHGYPSWLIAMGVC